MITFRTGPGQLKHSRAFDFGLWVCHVFWHCFSPSSFCQTFLVARCHMIKQDRKLQISAFSSCRFNSQGLPPTEFHSGVHCLGAPKPVVVLKPSCLQIVTRKRSFSFYRALLRSFADLHLRSFTLTCVLLCSTAFRTTAIGNCGTVDDRWMFRAHRPNWVCNTQFEFTTKPQVGTFPGNIANRIGSEKGWIPQGVSPQ